MVSAANIVVVGAGIVGAAIAAALAGRGRRVHVIEQGQPGGAVSGASLACIGAHMMDEDELPLLIWSCAAWADLAVRLQAFEYRTCGQIRFLSSVTELSSARHWIDLETKAGLPPRLIEPDEVRRIEPLLAGPLVAATWSPEDAVVNPFLAVRALLRMAQDQGATMETACPVLSVAVEGDRVRGVETPRGRIPADIVVLAGGPWTAGAAATAGVSLPIVPRKAQCLATVARPPSIRTVVGACKAEGGVDAGYTQIQQADSGQILFNTVLEGGADGVVDPNVIPEVDPVFVRDSVATLLRLFPSLAGVELLRSWVRFEAVTPDDRFLIGRCGPEGLLVAAGDGGTGFIRAPAIGRLVADMVDERDPAFRADIYDPARFSRSAVHV